MKYYLISWLTYSCGFWGNLSLPDAVKKYLCEPEIQHYHTTFEKEAYKKAFSIGCNKSLSYRECTGLKCRDVRVKCMYEIIFE